MQETSQYGEKLSEKKKKKKVKTNHLSKGETENKDTWIKKAKTSLEECEEQKQTHLKRDKK